MVRRTLGERFDGKKTNSGVLAGVIGKLCGADGPGENLFSSPGNKLGRGCVVINAASVAFETVSKG